MGKTFIHINNLLKIPCAVYIVKCSIPPFLLLASLAVLGIKPAALYMLGECPAIVLLPCYCAASPPSFYFFCFEANHVAGFPRLALNALCGIPRHPRVCGSLPILSCSCSCRKVVLGLTVHNILYTSICHMIEELLCQHNVYRSNEGVCMNTPIYLALSSQ